MISPNASCEIKLYRAKYAFRNRSKDFLRLRSADRKRIEMQSDFFCQPAAGRRRRVITESKSVASRVRTATQNGGAHALILEDDIFVKHPSTVAHSSIARSSQTYYDVITSFTTSSLNYIGVALVIVVIFPNICSRVAQSWSGCDLIKFSRGVRAAGP